MMSAPARGAPPAVGPGVLDTIVTPFVDTPRWTIDARGRAVGPYLADGTDPHYATVPTRDDAARILAARAKTSSMRGPSGWRRAVIRCQILDPVLLDVQRGGAEERVELYREGIRVPCDSTDDPGQDALVLTGSRRRSSRAWSSRCGGNQGKGDGGRGTGRVLGLAPSAATITPPPARDRSPPKS